MAKTRYRAFIIIFFLLNPTHQTTDLTSKDTNAPKQTFVPCQQHDCHPTQCPQKSCASSSALLPHISVPGNPTFPHLHKPNVSCNTGHKTSSTSTATQPSSKSNEQISAKWPERRSSDGPEEGALGPNVCPPTLPVGPIDDITKSTLRPLKPLSQKGLQPLSKDFRSWRLSNFPFFIVPTLSSLSTLTSFSWHHVARSKFM